MMSRQPQGRQMLIVAWVGWSLTGAAHANSISLGAIVEGTRTLHPLPSPGTATWSPGPSALLQAGSDGRVPVVIDSALLFDIGSVPGDSAITSATLSLTIAGTQSSIGPPMLRVTGFGSDVGTLLPTDLDGGVLVGSVGPASLPANSVAPDALNLPLQFDVTWLVQSLAGSGNRYVEIVLSDPNTSTLLVWGSAAADAGRRPVLTVAIHTPEPSSAMLMGLGLLGLAVAAWRRGRGTLGGA
jgi:hypothetical protein